MKKGYHINNDGAVLPCSTTPENCDFAGGQFSSEIEAYASTAFKEVIGQVSNIATMRKSRMMQRRAIMNDPEKRKERQEEESRKKNEEFQKMKNQYAIDSELSWGEIKPGQKSIHIYRSGTPEALSSHERGVESQSYVNADSVRPDGRTGRLEGFCASPTLGGVARWVNANSGIGRKGIKDFSPRKMKVDLDETYIYNIRAWESASSKDQYLQDNEEVSPYHEYWNSGITLREFVKLSQEDPDTYNPTKWEILLKPEDIQGSVQNVSYERVAKALYSDYDSERKNMIQLGKDEQKARRNK